MNSRERVFRSVNVETRCDDVERLYLWGEQVQLDEDDEDGDTVERSLNLVT